MPKWTKSSASVSTWLKPLGMTLMLLPATGCAILARGTEAHFLDTSCQAFRPITYSSRDTSETITEVRAHNRVFDRLCPAPE